MLQRRGRVKGPAASESRINEERRAEHKQGETAAGLRAAHIGAVPLAGWGTLRARSEIFRCAWNRVGIHRIGDRAAKEKHPTVI